jgi:hypothetical protein
MVPVPFSELVLVVVEALTPAPAPPAVVVVVLLVCADAVATATAHTALAANIFINLVCFMFVFALVKRMLSVVIWSDSFEQEFIQSERHLMIGTRIPAGCIQPPHFDQFAARI